MAWNPHRIAPLSGSNFESPGFVGRWLLAGGARPQRGEHLPGPCGAARLHACLQLGEALRAGPARDPARYDMFEYGPGEEAQLAAHRPLDQGLLEAQADRLNLLSRHRSLDLLIQQLRRNRHPGNARDHLRLLALPRYMNPSGSSYASHTKTQKVPLLAQAQSERVLQR